MTDSPSVEELQKKLSRASALLLSLMDELDRNDALHLASPAHEKWWRKYKKVDTKRRSKGSDKATLRLEAQRRLILTLEEQFTPEEIEALELKDELKAAKRDLLKRKK